MWPRPSKYPSVKTYHWVWRARRLEAALGHLNAMFGISMGGDTGVAGVLRYTTHPKWLIVSAFSEACP